MLHELSSVVPFVDFFFPVIPLRSSFVVIFNFISFYSGTMFVVMQTGVLFDVLIFVDNCEL